jgi:hypothetical protein
LHGGLQVLVAGAGKGNEILGTETTVGKYIKVLKTSEDIAWFVLLK